MTPTNPLEAFAARIMELSEKATPGKWDCWDMDEFGYHVFEKARGSSQDCRKSLMAVRWGRSHKEGPRVPHKSDPGRVANYFEMAANAELACELRNHATTLAAIASAAAECERALQEHVYETTHLALVATRTGRVALVQDQREDTQRIPRRPRRYRSREEGDGDAMTQEKQAADWVGLVELFDRIERRASEEGVLDALALSKLKEQTVALFRAVEPVREALEECEEYFDGMAEAEYFTESASPVPNEEMRRLVSVRATLALLDKIGTKP